MSDIKYAHQRIFFGAPGTGKSNKLNKQAEDCFGENYERVTFYSNFMYGNFVGSYKPFPKVKKNGEEYITYEYIGGVLMKQLINALKNPDKNYLLIIEEINRANVSAVFGDTFQLLDRDEDGKSEYFISTSIELQKYLTEQLKDNKAKNEDYVDLVGENFERLKFPGNFYIWATMNSADQGVMPMDTAFKRRWDFEYIGIDESVSSDFDEYYFYISDKEMVKWNDFRVELNRTLAELNIPEDKLLGPYFISKSILSNPEKLTEAIKNKVLMYLYEDVVRSNRHNLFVEEKQRTYSELCGNFTKYGLDIFSDKFNKEEAKKFTLDELIGESTINSEGVINLETKIDSDFKNITIKNYRVKTNNGNKVYEDNEENVVSVNKIVAKIVDILYDAYKTETVIGKNNEEIPIFDVLSETSGTNIVNSLEGRTEGDYRQIKDSKYYLKNRLGTENRLKSLQRTAGILNLSGDDIVMYYTNSDVFNDKHINSSRNKVSYKIGEDEYDTNSAKEAFRKIIDDLNEEIRNKIATTSDDVKSYFQKKYVRDVKNAKAWYLINGTESEGQAYYINIDLKQEKLAERIKDVAKELGLEESYVGIRLENRENNEDENS